MKTNNRGFTLIEMMVTIVIAGILMAIAIPNFRVAQRNNCMTTSANLLVASLQYARSEAIKRRQDVMVTAGAELGVPPADSDNEWGGGWYVWTEARQADNTLASDGYTAGDELRITTPNCAPQMDHPSGGNEFTYKPNGFVGDGADDDIEVCMDKTGERGRVLTVSRTGRPKVESDNDICDPSP